MKNILGLALLCISLSSRAQYYYNDLVGTSEISQRMKSFNQNKVTKVSALGYDAGGSASTDFNEWQEIKENGKALKVTTRNGYDKTVLYYRFDEQGRLSQVIDSTIGVQSVSNYKYDAAGRLVTIQNKTNDSDSAGTFSQDEVHQWIYNGAGKPEKLWRIVNGHDSTEIRFTLDDHGNIQDEQLMKGGTSLDPIYYYYNDENRLTDIVRYNTKARKLLPDFMFEYDEQGRVIQKITTVSSLDIGYLIWRYIYNEKGLKTKEALFNKDKQLTGRIEYSYSF